MPFGWVIPLRNKALVFCLPVSATPGIMRNCCADPFSIWRKNTDIEIERYTFNWRNLEIQVLHEPDWSPVFREIYGYAIAHLQVSCLNGKKLPFSETGYKSHFERADNIEATGGPAAFVKEWLDYASQENKIQKQCFDERQLNLF
ncbi:MAG: hypothetical protein QM808_17850 [Steroidobacteraceae bacterium]